MRNVLRTLLLALCLPLLFPAAALGHTGGERQTVRLTVETKEAQPGGSVRVDLRMTDCESADSLECDINYDPAALQLERVENGDVFPKEYTVTNIREKGRIRLAAISGPGVSSEGTVISMFFTVRGSGGGSILVTSAAVTTVDAEKDFEQLYAYVLLQNGGVTVNGAMAGAPAVTPWIGETPPPTPVPTPEPGKTAEPVPEPAASQEPTEEPSPTAEPEVSIALPDRDPIDPESLPSALLIMGIVFILLVLALISLLIVNSASRRKRKRKKASRSQGRKGRKPAGKRKDGRPAGGSGSAGADEEED